MLKEDKDLLRELISVISNWKNDLISPKQAFALARDAKYQTFAKCYERYATQIRAYNALDFDDLIMLPTLLFKRNEEVRSKWQAKIRYLLVDEYQDTNTSQYELIKLLVGIVLVLLWWAMMTNLFIRGVAHDRKIWCVYAMISLVWTWLS